jgi:hypothetical protein
MHRSPKRLFGAVGQRPQLLLDLTEDQLDRIQIETVGRLVAKFGLDYENWPR